MNSDFGIDLLDLAYYTVADGDGQTKAACEAGVDVGGDPGSAAQCRTSLRGVTDDLFRFGVSARLRHNDQTVGIVVATVTTDDRMGLPDVRHESLVTAVLARRDSNPLPGEPGPSQEDA